MNTTQMMCKENEAIKMNITDCAFICVFIV